MVLGLYELTGVFYRKQKFLSHQLYWVVLVLEDVSLITSRVLVIFKQQAEYLPLVGRALPCYWSPQFSLQKVTLNSFNSLFWYVNDMNNGIKFYKD